MQNLKILKEENFALSRMKDGNVALYLAPSPFGGRYIICLFGIFDRVHPNAPTNNAYLHFKEVLDSFPKNVLGGLLDVHKNPSIVNASKKTTTPITAVPKLFIFAPNGYIVNIFPRGQPMTAAAILSFIASTVPAQSKKPRQVTYSSEDDEDSSEEEPTPRRKASGKYYEPEFGAVPKVRFKGTIQQDEGEEFLLPEDVTPHNTPWLAET